MIYNFFRRYVQILASMKRLNLRVLEIWYPKFFKKDLEQVFALNNLKALNHQDFLKNIKILMIYTKCSDMFLPIYLTLLFRKFVRFHGTEDILYYTNGDGIESDMLWYLDALPFEYQWTSSRKKYWFRYLRCNNELLLFIIFDRSVFHFLNKRLFRLILVFRLKLYYLFKELFINKKDMCKYFYDYLLANERLSSIFYKILYILSKDGLPFLNKKLLFEKSVFIIRTNMIVTFNNMFYNELYWFIYHSGLPNYFFWISVI